MLTRFDLHAINNANSHSLNDLMKNALKEHFFHIVLLTTNKMCPVATVYTIKYSLLERSYEECLKNIVSISISY